MAVKDETNYQSGFSLPIRNVFRRSHPPPSRHHIAQVTGGLEEVYTKIQSGWQSVEEDYSKCISDDNYFQPHSKVGLLAGRYQVVRVLGKGTSSTIVQAQDTFRPGYSEVAIKILKPEYYRLGFQESYLMTELNRADIQNFSGIVRLLNTFTLGETFFCLTFELLRPWPLHQIFKKIPDKAQKLLMVRRVALRMLQILGFLGQQNVIHADLKPENILCSSENVSDGIKVIDFGNAIHCVYEELSLYYDEFELQTLLYRAPEVVLGLPFGQEIDMWSLGCILAECYMGKPLFWAKEKGDLLDQMTTLLGPLPTKTFQRAKFCSQYKESLGQPSLFKDTYSRLGKKLGCFDFNFVTYIQGMLALDPSERLTVSEAVQHPFIASELAIKFLLPSMSSSAPAEASRSYTAIDLKPSMYNHTPAGTGDVRTKHLSSLELLRRGTASEGATSESAAQKNVHVVAPFVAGDVVKIEEAKGSHNSPQLGVRGKGNRLPGSKDDSSPTAISHPVARQGIPVKSDGLPSHNAILGQWEPSSSSGGHKHLHNKRPKSKHSEKHHSSRIAKDKKHSDGPVPPRQCIESPGDDDIRLHQPAVKSCDTIPSHVDIKREDNGGERTIHDGISHFVEHKERTEAYHVTSAPQSQSHAHSLGNQRKEITGFKTSSKPSDSRKPSRMNRETVQVPRGCDRSPRGRHRSDTNTPPSRTSPRTPNQCDPDRLEGGKDKHERSEEPSGISSDVGQQFKYLQQQRAKAVLKMDRALGVNIKHRHKQSPSKSRKRTLSKSKGQLKDKGFLSPRRVRPVEKEEREIGSSDGTVSERKDLTFVVTGKKVKKVCISNSANRVEDAPGKTTTNMTKGQRHSDALTVDVRSLAMSTPESEELIGANVYEFEPSPRKQNKEKSGRKRSLPAAQPDAAKRIKMKSAIIQNKRNRVLGESSSPDPSSDHGDGPSSDSQSASSRTASSFRSLQKMLHHSKKGSESTSSVSSRGRPKVSPSVESRKGILLPCTSASAEKPFVLPGKQSSHRPSASQSSSSDSGAMSSASLRSHPPASPARLEGWTSSPSKTSNPDGWRSPPGKASSTDQIRKLFSGTSPSSRFSSVQRKQMEHHVSLVALSEEEETEDQDDDDSEEDEIMLL